MAHVVDSRIVRFAALGVVSGMVALSVACSRSTPSSVPMLPEPPKPEVKAAIPMKASHYGRADGLDGKKTASGEVFRSDALTAAHKTLPFGTKLEVKNPDNGKSVTVRVNDRGPFVKGRQLDLSAKAAETLGVQHEGVAEVVVTPVEK